MERIKEWTSKDLGEVSHIVISVHNSSRVVEVEYTNILDDLLVEFKTAQGRKEKGIVREKYRVAAEELNSRYKKPIYNPEL